EEVEEALKQHPSVHDAIVVGVADDRWGEQVVAVVEPRGDAGRPDEADLIAWVKGRLAGYNAPRRVLVAPSLGRGPNGKADYRRWRQEAAEAVRARP
ncbi:MAG: AMP-binding enzyme, partial [Acidimicrobiales bacterium]